MSSQVKHQDPGAADPALTLIAIFKLLKGGALIALGALGLLRTPDQLVEAAARHLGHFLPGRRLAGPLLDRVGTLGLGKERLLAAAALLYALVFFSEGIGLLRGKRWAEWLTVAVTGSFVPLEIYETTRHFTAPRLLTLAVNLAIVVYLVRRVATPGRGPSGQREAAR